MGQTAPPTRQSRTITVNFHDETTYFALVGNPKAFVEFVLAFLLAIGFQLLHKGSCSERGRLTRHSHYVRVRLGGLTIWLSLFRLNHRLPGSEAYPEVMQRTAQFHHQIADTLFPQTDAVFDNATALDTTVDVLDPSPTLVQRLVRHVLLPRELLAARCLRWHEDLDLEKREGEEA